MDNLLTPEGKVKYQEINLLYCKKHNQYFSQDCSFCLCEANTCEKTQHLKTASAIIEIVEDYNNRELDLPAKYPDWEYKMTLIDYLKMKTGVK